MRFRFCEKINKLSERLFNNKNMLEFISYINIFVMLKILT